jgi:predicted TIM-barrel fold metal-dependent hydrolase
MGTAAHQLVSQSGGLDVHQHLWVPELVEALRARSAAPRVIGSTLRLAGEPDYEIDPIQQQPQRRAAQDHGLALIVLSMSSPLGMESLPPDQARPLLSAWHDGVLQLPAPFSAWAAVSLLDPDLDELTVLLDKGLVGLQVPATALATPAALERLAPVLRVCEQAGRAVFVHPGPVGPDAARAGLPVWWPAVVDYAAQLHAAWWAWHAVGRSLLPSLRICFAAGGALGAVHSERFLARGGGDRRLDRDTFVDTSSYGARAQDALIRVLGIDVIVNGSDRPYAEPVDAGLGAAAKHAIEVLNPTRLLTGSAP